MTRISEIFLHLFISLRSWNFLAVTWKTRRVKTRQDKMISSHIVSGLLGLGCLVGGSGATGYGPSYATNNATKYVIMDNDWSSTGFIPYLIALDAGWEVLGLTSCAHLLSHD